MTFPEAGNECVGYSGTPGRRSTRTAFVFALASMILVTGCEKKEIEPPDRGAQVFEAEAMVTEEMFDTLAWDNDQARGMAGNLTYAAKCVSCHGPLGRGETVYAVDRGITVPSLVDPAWRFADEIEAVRRRIFAGHEAGMPTWGVAGISPREIDAAAFYVLQVLRPEVLASEGGS